LNLTEKLFYMPPVAAEHGARMDSMIDYVHWLMLALFIGWMGFFLYTIVRFRSKAHPRADYAGVKSHTSTYLELGVAVAEGVLLISFSIPGWVERVDKIPTGKDVVTVRIVGEQFAWNVHYPGKDGVFGRTDPAKIDTESNPLGLDRSDPAAADDLTTINQLHLPVDRPAVIHVSSKDVIHSFNLPHMRSKQDAVPGMSIPLWFTPTVTTDAMRERLGKPDFQYEIACAQLCGLGHYRMRGFLTVHTQEAYQAWIDEQTAQLAPAGEGDFWN